MLKSSNLEEKKIVSLFPTCKKYCEKIPEKVQFKLSNYDKSYDEKKSKKNFICFGSLRMALCLMI